MPYVNVPNDLSKIKTKIAFNLTKRQLICFGGAAVVGIPAYLLARSAIGNTGAMFVMLVVMLPAFLLAMYERDGLPFEKVVRNMRDMPILVLSSQDSYESWERAYQMGADDFMEKPLKLRECLLRAQALMRRYNAAAPPPPGERRYTIVNFENMRIDPLTRYVCYNGREIVLTKQEFDLLHLLARHAGQVLTHEQISYHIWGHDFVGDESNAIPVSISRLRQKLGDAPIETVRGVGYRFKKDATQKK